MRVELRGIDQPGETRRRLRLGWSAGSASADPFGVQDNTITEWAALGVACAMVSRYAGLRIQGVAHSGDRFDYWVTDGKFDYGMEVSGTMMEDIETRHRDKVRQLGDDPVGSGGYVVVVSFATRTVIFSLHRLAEELA